MKKKKFWIRTDNRLALWVGYLEIAEFTAIKLQSFHEISYFKNN